jgi:hypothetical protein
VGSGFKPTAAYGVYNIDSGGGTGPSPTGRVLLPYQQMEEDLDHLAVKLGEDYVTAATLMLRPIDNGLPSPPYAHLRTPRLWRGPAAFCVPRIIAM